MIRENRRDFLIRCSAAGAGAMLLPGWLGAMQQTDPPTQKAEPPQQATGADQSPQSRPAAENEMSIIRWKGDEAARPGDLYNRMTKQAIDELGGMARFVHRGDKVWVKPNIGWNRKPEFAANTHPDVVAAVVQLCFAAGAAKVFVGDNTCNDAKQSYENSGIAGAARDNGAEVVYLERSRAKDMNIGGQRLKDHPVFPQIVETDLVINVPVCKHHGSSTVTLCMKNYMGVVEKRQIFHQDLPTTIADITRFMKPRLCLLDATRILTAHGPTGGNLNDVKVLNTVAAGVDIVALDAFGCELLGHEPGKIGTVKAGEKYGLGKSDYRSLKLQEISLS